MANFKAVVSEYGLIGAIKTKTATLWANTAANIANLFSNPWTAALAVIAIAAIGVTVAWIISLTKETDKNTAANYKLSESQQETNKQTMDLAKKTAELADEWLNQMGIMDALIAKYNKLTEAEKQAAGSAEEILDTVPDLIDAYDELAENLFEEGSDNDKNYKLLR
jgi:ABC-type transporter Mla subunit MlaD